MSFSNVMLMAAGVLPAGEALRVTSTPRKEGTKYVEGAEAVEDWGREFCEEWVNGWAAKRNICSKFFNDHLQALDDAIVDLTDEQSDKPIWVRLGKMQQAIFSVEKKLKNVDSSPVAVYAKEQFSNLKLLAHACKAAVSEGYEYSTEKSMFASRSNAWDYEETYARRDGDDVNPLSVNPAWRSIPVQSMRELIRASRDIRQKNWREYHGDLGQELKAKLDDRVRPSLKTVGSEEELRKLFKADVDDMMKKVHATVDSPTGVVDFPFGRPGVGLRKRASIDYDLPHRVDESVPIL